MANILHIVTSPRSESYSTRLAWAFFRLQGPADRPADDAPPGAWPPRKRAMSPGLPGGIRREAPRE
jgi:hypothetical protein